MKKLFFLAVFCAFCLSAKAQHTSLTINQSNLQDLFLYASAEVCIQADREENSFKPLHNTALPTQASSFWLRYNIDNQHTLPLSVIMNMGYFEEVILYQYDAEGNLLKQEKTGMTTPLSERGLPIDAQILERLVLNVGKNTLYLHVKLAHNIHLSNLAYSLKRVSLKVAPQNFEVSYFNGNDRIFILLFLGAVALMLMYNAVIYFFLLDRNYLYYLVYLFFMGAYFFINKGLYVEWITPQAPQNKLWLSYVAILFGLIFQLLFTRRFLELKHKWRLGEWLIRGVLGLSVLVLGCFLIGFYVFLRNLMAFCMIVSLMSMLLVGIVMTWRKHSSAYYYLAGNVGLILGGLIFSLLTMNYLPSMVYTENAGLMGILFEMSLFSLGLANKINQAKKELAKRKLAEERREKALIEAKNIELEEKVLARTQDLKQANEELLQTLETIELQRNQIADKNQKLISSINYARRIQAATLPTQENIARCLPQAFMFYQPKDIVSGDFYWFTSVKIPILQPQTLAHLQTKTPHHAYAPNSLPAQHETPTLTEYTQETNEIVFLAVADCTGHGVPGAFMTILGETLLDQIISRDKIHSPAQILTELDTRLLKILQQDGQNAKINDGMDITLMRIDKAASSICWASAKRSIWVFEIDENDPIIYKGDKFPIGGSLPKQTKTFTENTFEVKPSDMVYTFTDGITDQFSGNDKFTPSRLKAVLNTCKDQDMSIQHDAVAHSFFDWKGDTPQTDDVLLVGLRL